MSDGGDSFPAVDDIVGQEAEVHEGCGIAIAFGHDRTSGAIANDSNFKPSLEEFAQMSFGAQVGRHAAQKSLISPASQASHTWSASSSLTSRASM